MQLTTLFVAALSASTLTTALPTVNTTDAFSYDEESEHGLEKRGNYGWLSSYAPNDPWCGFGYGGPRPKIKEGCVKFSGISNRVGIKWGTFPLAFSALDVYKDERCVVKIGEIPGPKKHKSKGAQTCVLQSKYGGKWRSVRSQAASP